MDDYKYLCMGCMSMKPSDAERCPNCGFSKLEENLPNQLKTHTVLNDRYIVGKALNENGESVLYLAYDTVKEEKVFIREFLPDTICTRKRDSSEIAVNSNCLAQYKTLLSEFIQLNKDIMKLRTIKQLQTVYELFPQNSTAYAVLEAVDGISLNNFLRLHSGKLSWDETKEVFTQIFTALELTHSEGIIHKGISPDTIFIRNSGSAVITDFCIGEVRTASTEIAAELYDGYTAPEQYSVSKLHGQWTDVYALAAVLYRCLTGIKPAEALSRLANDTLKSPYEIDDHIPYGVSKAIMNAMVPSYDKRTQSVNAFLSKLFDESIDIEKQEIELKKEQAAKSRLEAEKSNVSLALKVGLITFAVLAVIGLILIIIFVPNRSSSEANKISLTSSTSSSVTTTTTTTNNDESTTTTTNASKQYKMPNFVGEEYLRIQGVSLNMPLNLEAEYVYTSEYKKDVIFEQSIPEGTLFSEETTVTLKVSKGTQIVKLPNYNGKSGTDYVAELNSLGIKYELVYDSSYPDVENGMIVYVRYSNGNRIDVSTEIDLENSTTVYVVVSNFTDE